MGDCGEEDSVVPEEATDNRMTVESAQPSPEVLQKEKLIRLLKKEVLHHLEYITLARALNSLTQCPLVTRPAQVFLVKRPKLHMELLGQKTSAL